MAVVTKVEKRKRRIAGLKRKRGKQKLSKNRRLGYPSTIGVTRKRQVFIAKSAKNNKSRFLHKTARQIVKNHSAVKVTQTVKKMRKVVVKLKSKKTPYNKKRKFEKYTTTNATNTVVTTRLNRKTAMKKNITNATRLRMPGTGRIKNTFDALLRKQYTKCTPLINKNIVNKKIVIASKFLTINQLKRPDKVEAQAQLQQNQVQAQHAASLAYLSTVAR